MGVLKEKSKNIWSYDSLNGHPTFSQYLIVFLFKMSFLSLLFFNLKLIIFFIYIRIWHSYKKSMSILKKILFIPKSFMIGFLLFKTDIDLKEEELFARIKKLKWNPISITLWRVIIVEDHIF